MFARAERLLRHRALGTTALYRTVAVSGELVECEVVRAPGLDPGTRVAFTRAAVRGMVVVADPAAGARLVLARSPDGAAARRIASP